MANENEANWESESDFLTGVDLWNKSELVGRKFRIREVEIRRNDAQVEIGRFTVELPNGDFAQFQDSSSTGCLFQIKEHLTANGLAAAIDSGEKVAVAVICPRGLRESKYKRADPNRPNRQIEAVTHYLTSAGDVANVLPVPAKKTAQPVKAAPKKA